MALALYRKYRPRTFAEVIGQEHVTEPLSQALRSGRLHHAYLFSGPRGCGKTSSARILARSLNCEQGPTPEPCGVCGSCRSLANDGGGSIDVIEIDAASHGGVDDARDLREKAFFAPASSRFKIYVIDEAHMVSSAGFNALLKLVEEPPDYVKFIFATTEPEKVLGTIKSRTHHYPFRLIPPAVLRPYLQQLTEAEGVHVEPAVLPLVVRAGGGSARDSLSVLDQLISGAGPEGVTYHRAVSLLGVTDVALIDEMCDALAANDGATAYATIDRVAEAGHDPRRFASDLLERFRDLIILQQVPDAVSKGLIDGPADQLDAMSAQATRLGPGTLSRCADIVHNGLVEMRGTTAPRLLLELITARMLLPGADDSTAALLHRLERMERRLTLSDETGTSTTDEVRTQHPPASSIPAAASPIPAAADAPSAQPGAGGGISAARAAAASAGRRAPAVQAPSGQAPGAVGSGSGSTERTVVSGAAIVPDDGEWGAEPDEDDSLYLDEDSGAAAAGSVGELDRAGAQAAQPPRARRPEPAGVLPDAPEELDDFAAAQAPGQLSAAAIREVWPEIVTAVARQSKKIAALASGATVRELDGQTVVLTFRFPAHAKMVAAEPDLLANALYEALGGRWQIRCDVAGEAGAIQASSGGPPRRPAVSPAAPAPAAPAQGGSARSAQGAAPARRREAAAPPSAAVPGDDDDDWPEPAKPGGLTASSDPASVSGPAADSAAGDRPALTAAPDRTNAPISAPASVPTTAPGSPPAPAPTVASAPTTGRDGGSPSGSRRNAGVDGPTASTVGRDGGADRPGTSDGDRADASRGGAGNGLSGNRGSLGGLAAARAAAAGARNAAGAKPGTQPATGRPAAGSADGWSDGSPAQEPPYDPEYDGPVRAGTTTSYQGFDPGDEPLDDVIDEKTARQSSEQQAMQLLQDTFGAEKIGES